MHTETESEPTNGESEKPKLAVVTKNLKIKLTEDEFVDRAKQLSKAIAEYNAVEAEKKSVAKDYADKLAGIDSNVQELRKVIEESAEFRDVEVTVERDLFAKKVITRLASTGEIVEERAMQEHDRQLELQVAAQQASEGGDVIAMELPKTTEAERRAHEEHGELTEEQRFADTPEEAEAMRDARLADEFSDGHETAELPVVETEKELF